MSVIINVKIITVHPNEELDLYPKANGAFAWQMLTIVMAS